MKHAVGFGGADAKGATIAKNSECRKVKVGWSADAKGTTIGTQSDLETKPMSQLRDPICCASSQRKFPGAL